MVNAERDPFMLVCQKLPCCQSNQPSWLDNTQNHVIEFKQEIYRYRQQAATSTVVMMMVVKGHQNTMIQIKFQIAT